MEQLPHAERRHFLSALSVLPQNRISFLHTRLLSLFQNAREPIHHSLEAETAPPCSSLLPKEERPTSATTPPEGRDLRHLSAHWEGGGMQGGGATTTLNTIKAAHPPARLGRPVSSVPPLRPPLLNAWPLLTINKLLHLPSPL